MRRSLVGLAFVLALALPLLTVRLAAAGEATVDVYFFWSATCPHCEAAKPFVESLPVRRPSVRLHSLEITRHPDNLRLFESMAAELGKQASAVPTIILCGDMVVGWHSDLTTGAELERRLESCDDSAAAGLEVPILGTVQPGEVALPLLTIAIAGLDAFNPCAFFVLLFLLSLMARQRSRRRMMAVGGVFVAVSGVMYFAFMAAWLSLFTIIGALPWVTGAAGGLAVVVGAFSIKDYFAFARGPSLSIPQSRKPDLYRRARAVVAAGRLPAAMAATIALAVAANLYELLCTAGFPMVYTRLLTLSGLSEPARLAYLGLYNLVYVLPLLVIVALFVHTMRGRWLAEREGRVLKLLSGVMMVVLGGVLLTAPHWLAEVPTALALVVIALAVTLVVARRR